VNHQEILRKAIIKAIEGGWSEYGDMSGNPNAPNYLLFYEESPDIYTWLFSHDFAKALWRDIVINGVEVLIDENAPTNMFYGMPAAPFTAKKPWQYHLQQMVVADDPIEYLGAHI